MEINTFDAKHALSYAMSRVPSKVEALLRSNFGLLPDDTIGLIKQKLWVHGEIQYIDRIFAKEPTNSPAACEGRLHHPDSEVQEACFIGSQERLRIGMDPIFFWNSHCDGDRCNPTTTATPTQHDQENSDPRTTKRAYG
jgi:hypothetical protein